MEIIVTFLTEAIPRPVSFGVEGNDGALAEFYGIIRQEEAGERIAGLNYEIYSDMAEKEIRRILGELRENFPCRKVMVIHRHGFVPVGDAAIYVGVLSRHRQEGFGLLSAFMDRLKKDVPIWKVGAVSC